MNGSYSVPIGSSRSPLIECDRPSADSTMNRFISAMPSSMCWPFGENSQLKVDGMRSLLKVSAMLSRANRPRRFTHGPRLVDTVTSGEVVTMRSASGVFSRASSFSSAPKPNWVDISGWIVTASCSGTATCGAFRRRSPPEANGTLPRNALIWSGFGSQALEQIPLVAFADVHRVAECFHLRRRHQPGVVVLVAGDRQAEALHRVGDEAGRPVVVDLVERLDDRRQVVAAEIVHQPRQLVVGALLDQLASPRPGRRSRPSGACATRRRPWNTSAE